MPSLFERPLDSEDSISPDPANAVEPGALFIRAGAKKAQPLTRWEAETIEGLLMLMDSDDWKETFVTGILHTFRDGSRETPADVLFDLRQAAAQFDGDVELARGIAKDYRSLLKTDAPASETYAVVGSGMREQSEPEPKPKRKAKSSRR